MCEQDELIDKRLEELESMDQSVLVKHLPRKEWPEDLIKGKTLLWQIPRTTGKLLHELIRAHKPKRILELGTSGGYSTLWMARAIRERQSHIDTIEFSTYRYEIAARTFRKTKTNPIITLHQGKTHDILDRWTTTIDFLFIDHGKEHYLADLKRIEHLLSQDAVIIADNIFDNPGKVKEFTDYLENDSRYRTHILSIDNGLLLAYKTCLENKYVATRTEDGSMTFNNRTINETYHSTSGAFEEALKKHVEPSRILEKAKGKDHLVIADICFGLGYNSLIALRELFKQGFQGSVNMIAFENDTELMKKSKRLDFGNDIRNESDIIRSLLDTPYSYTDDTITAQTKVGDVRKTIKTISDDTFDAVFFDPFSPRKHPHLWSEELFRQVYRTMKRDAVVTTYSCARMIRDNLKKAGFIVRDGPTVGRRSPGTIAIKH
ncbi:MAG: MnmC family methyltransferase [Nanoarchaeota archaeon]